MGQLLRQTPAFTRKLPPPHWQQLKHSCHLPVRAACASHATAERTTYIQGTASFREKQVEKEDISSMPDREESVFAQSILETQIRRRSCLWKYYHCNIGRVAAAGGFGLCRAGTCHTCGSSTPGHPPSPAFPPCHPKPCPCSPPRAFVSILRPPHILWTYNPPRPSWTSLWTPVPLQTFVNPSFSPNLCEPLVLSRLLRTSGPFQTYVDLLVDF